MMKRSLIGAALIVGALSAGQAQAACGKVTISDMNWASATLIANVDKLILKHGYGCDAELIPGDTMPTSTSIGPLNPFCSGGRSEVRNAYPTRIRCPVWALTW